MYHNKFTLWNRKLKINICKAKFSFHKQRLFGVPFATIAKKTYTCKKILLDFHSVRKEIRNNLQTFAVTAVKILNKSFLFYLITGRYYSGKCWSQFFFFTHHNVGFYETNVLKDVYVSHYLHNSSPTLVPKF